jgi:predicted TIM-barrel fold metal-dependent hydrolase
MNANPQPTAYGRIFPPRADWLARAPVEPIIEPELAIIDTHHHVWRDRGRYMLDEVLADMGSGHNVVASVFIDCRFQYRTDLTLGDRVEPVLTALVAAGRGRFRGVRNSAGWHEDPVIGNNHHGAGPGHYLRADFRAGLNRLSAMGLSLDALVYHHQHADLVDLARACPDANIIMNHTGMPLGYGPFAGKEREVYAQWRAKLPDLAACPNVSMKLGGMMMRLAAYDYNRLPAPPSSEQLAAYWRPYIEPCIELFGAERCTFESNFPVDKMGIGYAALWNAFKRIAANASADEKAALFNGTARRVYRLR